jgi:hypothetical protein
VKYFASVTTAIFAKFAARINFEANAAKSPKKYLCSNPNFAAIAAKP